MKKLQDTFDKLQEKYGSKELNSVYGYGDSDSPNVALVFMNPTKRNIATNKSWCGIRAQWLGTKQIWEFLTKCDLISKEIMCEIKAKKPSDWSPEFCEMVYRDVSNHKVWITNLAKCSQDDARPLPDKVFLEYKNLLLEEIDIIKPKKILFFGNQVSSIMLDEKICVSQVRQKEYILSIGSKEYMAYAVYYPVGNGRFNQDKAIEDINAILKNN